MENLSDQSSDILFDCQTLYSFLKAERFKKDYHPGISVLLASLIALVVGVVGVMGGLPLMLPGLPGLSNPES